MNPVDAFEVGLAPQHLPALIAVLLLPLAVLAIRRLRPVGAAPATAIERPAVNVWAAWLLAIAAVVHLALPLGHFDGLLLAAAFLGSRADHSRHRRPSQARMASQA